MPIESYYPNVMHFFEIFSKLVIMFFVWFSPVSTETWFPQDILSGARLGVSFSFVANRGEPLFDFGGGSGCNYD